MDPSKVREGKVVQESNFSDINIFETLKNHDFSRSMHALTESVWEVISWKSKSRYDTASDQYTRIFMPKLFIISSLIMAFSYFNDKLNCLVHKRLETSKDFVQETCWIQGFYIYHEMEDHLTNSAFYGIPEETSKDGMNINGALCETKNRQKENQPHCRPMTRRYFLHYQWIPFYVCSLAVLYFFPYLIFKFGNADLISLVDYIRTGGFKDVDKIVNNYFNYKINSKLKMRLIVWFNIFIKLLFILVNVSGFILTDFVMGGRFLSYGPSWLRWNELPNDVAHNLMKSPAPKPGDYFLPSVGLCNIHEMLKNERATYTDEHKVICEISQNIRYQYIFIILWFFFLVGVITSILGLLHTLFTISKSLFWVYYPKFFPKKSLSDRVHSQLTLREMEYLDKIRSVDLTMYGEILRELTRFKPDIQTLKRFQTPNGCEMITLLPTAPLGDVRDVV
uniref:Innexin n=2 Tax=Clytia hemisphaerica TaxID=252671 RepID=A0A7M5WUJ7_9CNID